jgi:predicted DNA-binding protein (MmcQ/YjbR family)
LKGTTEKMPFQKFVAAKNVLVFYVSGKMYCLIDIDRFHSCTVKCQPERIEQLKAQYNGITDPYNMSHRHWIGISFESDVDDSLLKQLILNAHDIVMK